MAHHRRMRLPVAALMAGMVLVRMFLQLERGQVRWGQARPSPCTWPRPNSQATHRWPRPSTTSRRRSTRHPGACSGSTTTFDAQGDHKARSDQVVAGMVQQGKYDLAVVPARSWDDLGVVVVAGRCRHPSSLDSDDLVDEIVTGDLAEPADVGALAGTGVHALDALAGGAAAPRRVRTLHCSRLQDFQRGRGSWRTVLTATSTPCSVPSEAIPCELDGASHERRRTRLVGSRARSRCGPTIRPPGPPATITADVTLLRQDRHARRRRRQLWEPARRDEAALGTRRRRAATRATGWSPNVAREAEAARHACATTAWASPRPGPAAAAANRARNRTRPSTQMRADPELGPDHRRARDRSRKTRGRHRSPA